MPSRYHRAISRNAAELQKAILIRHTLVGIESLEYTAETFIRIVREALFNDYISHAIKVFEDSKKASSFWYIYRTDERPILRLARELHYDMNSLRSVTSKLKVIRNGTHFHIDQRGVLDPKAVWRDADLKGNELAAAIDFAWNAITSIQIQQGLAVTSLGSYSVDEATLVVRRIRP